MIRTEILDMARAFYEATGYELQGVELPADAWRALLDEMGLVVGRGIGAVYLNGIAVRMVTT